MVLIYKIKGDLPLCQSGKLSKQYSQPIIHSSNQNKTKTHTHKKNPKPPNI